MEMEVPTISFGEFVANYQAELLGFLTPVLLLVCWTLVMWLWMYATRIPAMNKAKIDPDEARHPGTYGDRLPANVRAIADNYNHLHEQPTLFYALMVFAALTGGADGLMMNLGYAYVGIRVLHSIVQALSPKVALRFMVFALGSIVLFVMAGKEVIRVFL
ncbi:MAG: MAPEG family protein [Pseudomonadota bacterium]